MDSQWTANGQPVDTYKNVKNVRMIRIMQRKKIKIKKERLILLKTYNATYTELIINSYCALSNHITC
jgi:hypothetical protein